MEGTLEKGKMENWMAKLIISFLIIIVSAGSLYPQSKTIKGRLISNQFDFLIGVTVMINDTIRVGKTDVNGFFQIDIPVYVKKISFGGAGLEPAIIELVNKCDEVEVVLLLRATHESDRIRKKRFKKLPELHNEAFAKGIFKTNKACYIQEFMPDYYKKQK